MLTGPLGISGRMIQRLTRGRGVTLNGRPAFMDRLVRAGDVIAARIADRETPTLPPVEIPLSIVYEDADLVVVDKAPGELVHPTAPHHTRTVAHGLAHRYAGQGIELKVRPVHRLDRDTSGVLLVAKTAFAHQRLDRQLREGTLTREYLAVVEGVIEEEEGVIDQPIGPSRKDPRLRMVRPDGQHAVTRFSVLERLPGATVVQVALETGRTHQIRVHTASAGHPIVGDMSYGAARSPWIRRPALHAVRLRFDHPATGEPLEVSSPIAPDIEALRARTRRD
ncbi:MAG: RluA family pseudouridine synthase [Gemmatimonadota bacterium]|jgi:RluA family pseudouridine synthase|nr:RluA family pseudouridine synthase [Gemmatimonadota bacterium]